MIVRNREQILGAALSRLTRETDVSITTPGGVAQTFFAIIAEELGYDFRIMDANISSLFVSTAGGTALEKLGSIFGVARQVSYSSIDSNRGRIYFYLNSNPNHELGTSDEDAETDIVIPAGTFVSTQDVGYGQNPITWVTTEECTILTGSHMAFASIKPVTSTLNSVGSGTMLYHNLDTSTFPHVYVYNRMDLEVYDDIESDGNYRFRIVNAINMAAKGNTLALRLAALGTPGVRDCKVVPMANGVGTVKVVVVPDSAGIDDANGYFSSAVTNIVAVASAGDILEIVQPSETRVDIKAVVSGNVTSRELAAIEANITRYIASLSIGETISSARIINEAITSSPNVKDFAIMDGGFTFNSEPRVFAKVEASEDEMFYPGTIDIYNATAFAPSE
jgi:uncharacterized phage protein gp47/JayE